MLTEAMEKKCLEIARYYGFDAQTNQLIEECAELIQAINKYKRKYIGGQPLVRTVSARDQVVEEIADVEVMLCQIKYLLKIPENQVEEVERNKIERTISRIEESIKKGRMIW